MWDNNPSHTATLDMFSFPPPFVTSISHGCHYVALRMRTPTHSSAGMCGIGLDFRSGHDTSQQPNSNELHQFNTKSNPLHLTARLLATSIGTRMLCSFARFTFYRFMWKHRILQNHEKYTNVFPIAIKEIGCFNICYTSAAGGGDAYATHSVVMLSKHADDWFECYLQVFIIIIIHVCACVHPFHWKSRLLVLWRKLHSQSWKYQLFI